MSRGVHQKRKQACGYLSLACSFTSNRGFSTPVAAEDGDLPLLLQLSLPSLPWHPPFGAKAGVKLFFALPATSGPALSFDHCCCACLPASQMPSADPLLLVLLEFGNARAETGAPTLPGRAPLPTLVWPATSNRAEVRGVVSESRRKRTLHNIQFHAATKVATRAREDPRCEHSRTSFPGGSILPLSSPHPHIRRADHILTNPFVSVTNTTLNSSLAVRTPPSPAVSHNGLTHTHTRRYTHTYQNAFVCERSHMQGISAAALCHCAACNAKEYTRT